MYLRNSWYVAALSSDVGANLTALRILDENIVLYRSKNGDPVALEDSCPHRRLPLSKGRLLNDNIECGYHGLQFDRSGQCVAAPTQDRIPPSAVVRSYPVIDRWGLVWIWMGNADLSDDNLIVNIENYDNPDWKISKGDALTFACNYKYIMDNLLDPSHVAWVHRASFAAPGTDNTPLEITETDKGLVVHRWIYGNKPPPFYAPLLQFEGDCDRYQYYEAQYPCTAINKGIYVPAGKGGPDFKIDQLTYVMISYHFMTPIDANNTRYHWLQHRNTDPDNEAVTASIAADARAAFLEDRDVLEAVHTGIANETTRHIKLGLDAASLQFRRKLEELILEESDNSP
ncbi:MAG: aromatic ring-hydroxylating dioxygenase subunit alpha [Gammaproteobacteria bacterium]|nr:aromatic ring-hydroxylating dioxygenase subunit alpha [Gammaproteobacteria bacterium]MDH5303585.1 aromatic ring-hydroxylating dioxygenase subunit alpha [Gammaproteobacteria bacterium]MDH5320929.1 aromatic ring-hydroxylating dioxygenase subunit alpha [Gammaproteobacteria bacterium]